MAEFLDQEQLEIFGDIETYNRFCQNFSQETLEDSECPHSETYHEDHVIVCRECGMEREEINFEPEWRYYGDYKGNPGRCHKTKASSRGISKVFETLHLDIPGAICAETEVRYDKIVGQDMKRGKGRHAIIFVCLMHVYRDNGDVRTADEVAKMGGLDKKVFSAALMKYYEKYPDDRVKHIRPCDLIRRILILSGIHMSHYKAIIDIAKFLENRSVGLNRSSPQSVASAVVYLYLCKNPEVKEEFDMSKSKFASKVCLSDITITKIVKEAVRLIGWSGINV